MKNLKNNPKLVVAITFAGVLGAITLYGCESSPTPPAKAVAPALDPPASGQKASDQAASDQNGPKFALFGPAPKKSGVELWSDNCSRCHNMRPPESFSAAQWETIVHHMRLRANLTGEEAREIVKFLQASNGT